MALAASIVVMPGNPAHQYIRGELMATENTKSAERALRVLDTLSEVAGTFTDVYRRLRIPRSSLHNILSTLERMGWIKRGADYRYRVVTTLTPTPSEDDS